MERQQRHRDWILYGMDRYIFVVHFFICPYLRFLVYLVLVAESEMGKFTPASAAG